MSEIIREFHKLPYEQRVAYHIAASEKQVSIEELLLIQANNYNLAQASPKKGQPRLEVV